MILEVFSTLNDSVILIQILRVKHFLLFGCLGSEPQQSPVVGAACGAAVVYCPPQPASVLVLSEGLILLTQCRGSLTFLLDPTVRIKYRLEISIMTSCLLFAPSIFVLCTKTDLRLRISVLLTLRLLKGGFKVDGKEQCAALSTGTVCPCFSCYANLRLFV